MGTNGINTVMSQVKGYEVLSNEEEYRLAEQMHGSDPIASLEARNTLITANLRFVAQLPHGYAKSSETPFADYFAACLEAAVKYSDKILPNVGKFITFIKPWVRKALQEVHYTDSMVTVPRHKHIMLRKVSRAAEILAVENGPFIEITDEMISVAAGVSVDVVKDCFALKNTHLRRPISLDSPLSLEDGGDNLTFKDAIADDSAALLFQPRQFTDEAINSLVGESEGVISLGSGASESFQPSQVSDEMLQAFEGLTVLEANAILSTAGLGNLDSAVDDTPTLTETAASFGVTISEFRSALQSARLKMAESISRSRADEATLNL
jgi:DNA-directed RNA polymerase specialized sigma subunit